MKKRKFIKQVKNYFSSSTSLAILIGISTVVALLLINSIISHSGQTRLSIITKTNTGLVFEKTVYDEEQSVILESLPEALIFAGPLLRQENAPLELIEMTPGLSVIGSSVIDGGYYYASSKTGDNQITFLGGGCTHSSGAWATCSEQVKISPGSQIPISGSRELELDFHELESDDKGGFWAIKFSSIDCLSIEQKHCSQNTNGESPEYIGDCNIVHIVDGQIVSSWSAYENLPDGESTSERYNQNSDIFHCNSIEQFKIDGEQKILISLRNTDSVYQVDVESGIVDWKLGGNDWAGHSLKLRNPGSLNLSMGNNNPGAVLSGQHDARYWGEGIYSVFDNGSQTGRAARGIVFSINEGQRTATIEQVFIDPEGVSSGCTGSFRQISKGNYWVAGWGCSTSGITVFDNKTRPIVGVKLDQNAPENRALTVPGTGLLQWALSYRVTVE